MICKYCNKEIQDNSVICPACGKRLVKNSLFSQLYKFSEIPRRYFVCGVVLLISGIVSVLSFFLFMDREHYTLKENFITYVNEAMYVNGIKVEDYTITKANSNASIRGNVIAFFDADSIKQEGDGSAGESATLYFVKADDATEAYEVAEEVREFVLSPYGSYIAYVNTEDELHLYNCKKQTDKKIDRNALVNNICVADDGSIAYLTKRESGEYMHIYKGGEPIKWESDRIPVSISNGAKHVYMLDSVKNLYHYDGSEEEKIAVSVEGFWFNEKGDDIFYHADDKTFVYGGSGEPKELADEYLTFVPCDNLALYESCPLVDGGEPVLHYGISEFSKKYYVGDDDTLYFLNGRWEFDEVAEKVDDAKPAVDGKSVVYVAEGELMIYHSSSKKHTEIAEDVTQFVMTDDARMIYYTDDEFTLYVKFGNKEPSEIAENVVSFDITHKEYLFYVLEDGGEYELFAVKGTGEAESICDGLERQPELDYAMIKYADGEDEYVSRGDLKFEKQ